jgi:hypothetical protein
MYVGPAIDDEAIFPLLPRPYANLLQRMNGYVAYHGALHVRGACREPLWHSLRYAWTGDGALHRLYPDLTIDDIPFAEDAIGDQYIIRDETVHQLSGETGEITSREMDIVEFDAAVRANPFEFLLLGPLQQLIDEGGTLQPGELLSVMPPLVISREPGERTSVRAIPARERIEWLAMLARKIRDLPDGGQVIFKAGDD